MPESPRSTPRRYGTTPRMRVSVRYLLQDHPEWGPLAGPVSAGVVRMASYRDGGAPMYAAPWLRPFHT